MHIFGRMALQGIVPLPILLNNGVAERMNRTILEKVRCMLFNSKRPKSFWTEAVSTVCYIINRSPSIALDKKTPMEV